MYLAGFAQLECGKISLEHASCVTHDMPMHQELEARSADCIVYAMVENWWGTILGENGSGL